MDCEKELKVALNQIMIDEDDGQVPTTSEQISLDDEDCQYLLRCYELDAFASVVRALRAQGMLTEHKLKLLEHLKSALFISSEEYYAQLRLAANDNILLALANKLNPSYDTFTQWSIASADPVPRTLFKLPARDEEDTSNREFADKLLSLAISHNETLDNFDELFADIVDFPNVPHVPEKLLAFLKYSQIESHRLSAEELSSYSEVKKHDKAGGGSSRAEQVDKSKKVVHKSTPSKTFSKRRKIEHKSESSVSVKKSATVSIKSDPKSVRSLRKRPLSVSKKSAKAVDKAPPEKPSNIKSTCKNDIVNGDDIPDDEDKVKGIKESSRKSPDDTFVCARVLPFVFKTTATNRSPKIKLVRSDKRQTSHQSMSPTRTYGFSSASSPAVSGVLRAGDCLSTKSLHSTRPLPLSPTIPVITSNPFSHNHRSNFNPYKRARNSSYGGSERFSADHYYHYPTSIIHGSRERFVPPSSYLKYRTSSQAFTANKGQAFYGHVPNASAGHLSYQNAACSTSFTNRNLKFGDLSNASISTHNTRSVDLRHVSDSTLCPNLEIRRATITGRAFRNITPTSQSSTDDSYQESTHALVYADVVGPQRHRSIASHHNKLDLGLYSDEATESYQSVTVFDCDSPEKEPPS